MHASDMDPDTCADTGPGTCDRDPGDFDALNRGSGDMDPAPDDKDPVAYDGMGPVVYDGMGLVDVGKDPVDVGKGPDDVGTDP